MSEMEEVAKLIGNIEVKSSGIKTKERALQKIKHDYDGNIHRIKDICRATFVTKNDADFKTMLATFKEMSSRGYRTYEVKN